jgi:hypothetical protein
MRFGQALVSGDPIIDSPSRSGWFKTSVFLPLPAYTRRTNPWQYEGLTGPRNWNVDATLAKSFRVTERLRLEFRLEAYNMTNSFIPTDPVVAITNASFGKSVNQSNRGREVQYAVRLQF